MKIEKNKIVFSSVLAVILIFLIGYSYIAMSEDDSDENSIKQTLVPELEEEQKEYESKLDAVNDLQEVKERNVPSIYDEKLIDSSGYYDPNLEEKNKERIVDSIYALGRTRYSELNYRNVGNRKTTNPTEPEIDSADLKNELKTTSKEMGLEHKLFFASTPVPNEYLLTTDTDAEIYAEVDGEQVVKADYRLRMRLTRSAKINGIVVPKNTPVFGFISFKPNRAMVEIENIGHRPVKLKVYDLEDGSEGIYVKNNFRAEASTEVLDDIVEDINIPSVPQVSGITRVFRRNNGNVRATISNKNKIMLKLQL
ncbi:conjugative transposon protein TraM [Maribacter sp. 2210JD10-5]|uniref:conjugative transposon protein TraM n=1 Tax=Maribacter sp. 2210JD10-5 TaxID=3386272 RepID=UPI0039BCEA1C